MEFEDRIDLAIRDHVAQRPEDLPRPPRQVVSLQARPRAERTEVEMAGRWWWWTNWPTGLRDQAEETHRGKLHPTTLELK